MRHPLFLNLRSIGLVLLMVCLSTVHAQALRAGGGAPGPRVGLSVAPGLLAVPDRSADFIVALVDNEPITNHDVRMAVQRLREQAAQAGITVQADKLGNDALELLIFERSQIQWANQSGLRITDAELQTMAEGIASRNQLSLDELYREIERQGLTKKRFLQNLKEQQILQRLRERDVPGRVRVTELEIDRFLTQQKASLVKKASLELAQILLPVPDQPSDDQVKQAEQTARQWLREIEQGADFFELARQRSGSPDRIEGGRMGLREADRYPDLFIEATRATPVGGLAGPIRSGAGFHLLKVIQRNQSANLTVTQTRARHILLRPGGSLSQNAARARLFQYKTEIERGQADFAQLAREHSADGSAAEGGDLGWSSPGQFVPEFEEVLDGLRPGQISDPLISRFGVHIIQVMERRDVPLTPAQERDFARRALREAKYDETLQTWAQEIRGKAFIEYREPPQ
jgi:peptidyl-prolyl cis-trans isomerase SurA